MNAVMERRDINKVKLNKQIKRGEIWLADLGDGIGSEQRGVRPCICISNNKGNYYSSMVQIAPITSKVKTPMPTHVYLEPKKCGLTRDSIALVEQTRTISKSRLLHKVGEVKDINVVEDIDIAISISFGLAN